MSNEFLLRKAGVHALRFAEWCHQRGVPRENIHLFLSSAEIAEPEIALRASGFELPAADAACFDTFLNGFNGLTELSGDLLYVYWSGHGTFYEDERRFLYFEDLSVHAQYVLDVSDFLRRLRSKPAKRFALQIAYVDACANHFDQSAAGLQPLRVIGGSATPLQEVEQMYLFATKPREEADAVAFSEVVLKALGDSPEDIWPPDHDAVIATVRNKVLLPAQTPVQIIYRTMIGDTGDERVMGDLPASPFVNAVARQTMHAVSWFRGLAAILADYSTFASAADESGRAALYGDIQDAARLPAVMPPGDADAALLHIVASAFHWNVVDALAEAVRKRNGASADFDSELSRVRLMHDARRLFEDGRTRTHVRQPSGAR